VSQAATELTRSRTIVYTPTMYNTPRTVDTKVRYSGATQDALQAPRRLDTQFAAAGQQRRPHPVVIVEHHRTDLRGQPLDQTVFVVPSGLPEPRLLPDLHPSTDRSAIPTPQCRVHLHLTHHVINCRSGHLPSVAGNLVSIAKNFS
jgi:hypothetical protein